MSSDSSTTQHQMQTGNIPSLQNYQHHYQHETTTPGQKSMIESCFTGESYFEPIGTSKQYEDTKANLQNLNQDALTTVPKILQSVGFDQQKYLEEILRFLSRLLDVSTIHGMKEDERKTKIMKK